jgi:hypothetical protein
MGLIERVDNVSPNCNYAYSGLCKFGAVQKARHPTFDVKYPEK